MEGVPQSNQNLATSIKEFTATPFHPSTKTNKEFSKLAEQVIQECSKNYGDHIQDAVKTLKNHQMNTIPAHQSCLHKIASSIRNFILGDHSFRTSAEIATNLMEELEARIANSTQSSGVKQTPPKKTTQELKKEILEGLKKDANMPFPPDLTAKRADSLLNSIINDLMEDILQEGFSNPEKLDLAARAADRIHNEEVKSNKVNEVAIYRVLSNITPLKRASSDQKASNAEGFKVLDERFSKITNKYIKKDIKDYISLNCAKEYKEYKSPSPPPQASEARAPSSSAPSITSKGPTQKADAPPPWGDDPKGYLIKHLRSDSLKELPPALKSNPALANAILTDIIDDVIGSLQPISNHEHVLSNNRNFLVYATNLAEKITDPNAKNNKLQELSIYSLALNLAPIGSSTEEQRVNNDRIYKKIDALLEKTTNEKPPPVEGFKSANKDKDIGNSATQFIDKVLGVKNFFSSESIPNPSLSPEENVKQMTKDLGSARHKGKFLSNIMNQLNDVKDPNTRKELALSLSMNMGINKEETGAKYSIKQKTALLTMLTGLDESKFAKDQISSTTRKISLKFHPDKLTRSDTKLIGLTNDLAKLEKEKNSLVAQKTENPVSDIEQKLQDIRGKIEETKRDAKDITDKYANVFATVNGLTLSLKADFDAQKANLEKPEEQPEEKPEQKRLN